MELTTLRYFVKLSEYLNFTEAARQLFITQSTLSLSIKNLEAELGVQLFERIGHNVYLTEMGELFLPHARASIEQAQAGVQALVGMQGVYRGELRIGVISSLYPIFMECLLLFTRDYPDVHIVIRYSPSIIELSSLIADNRLDLALGYSPSQPMALVECEELFTVPLMVILSSDHPLAKRKFITAEMLTDYSVVLLSEGVHTRNMVDKICRKAGVRLRSHIEVNEVSVAVELVETGRWVSILGRLNIQGHESLEAIPLKGEESVLKASLLRPKDGYRKPTAHKFAEMIKESCHRIFPRK